MRTTETHKVGKIERESTNASDVCVCALNCVPLLSPTRTPLSSGSENDVEIGKRENFSAISTNGYDEHCRKKRSN